MKKIITLIILGFFSYTSIAISAEPDCSNPKKISEKLLCKVSSMKKSKDGSKKPFFKTPKILQKLNKWSAENKTLIK